MIWKNFTRDLHHTASRLISASIIAMITVMVYTAPNGILTNTERISASYLEGQNVTNYWFTGVNLGQGDCRTLEDIVGVTEVRPRMALDAEERHDNGVMPQLYAVPGGYAINTPYVMEGRLLESSREVVLNDTLAGVRELRPGDWYESTLMRTDWCLQVRISGLVKDPEYPYYMNTTASAPDLTHYTLAYGDETPLQELMGVDRYNQICITTNGSLSAARLRLAVDAALGDQVVNTLSLEDSTRAHYLLEMWDSLASILNIFPVLFFLCAVLMMMSTISRLIENAHPNIGTFEALGYSDVKIVCHYPLHTPLVVVVGFPVDAWLGRYVSILIISTITVGCGLPPCMVVYNFAAWGRTPGLTTLCCIESAWLMARSLLKGTPAQCMRPKPPRNTKPATLERLGPVWHRSGSSQKYIIRNTLRSKVRMVTYILGIVFYMALVFLAFVLRDLIRVYSDVLTERQNHHGLMVGLSISVTGGQYRWLADNVDITEAELGMNTAYWLYTDSQRATTTLTVAGDQVLLKRHDPYAEGAFALPGNGLVLGESLTDKLELRAGNRVTFRFAGGSRYYFVPVAEVNRCVNGIYLSHGLWRGPGLAYMPTTVYLTSGGPEVLTKRLGDYDPVDAWRAHQAAIVVAVERLSSIPMVVHILILFGGGLACIVIHSLGTMSFFGWLHNLATLMVLGFYKKKIETLQLGENIIFAICGVLPDTPPGVSPDRMTLTPITTMPLTEVTRPASLALSCAATLLFALAVNVVIGRKMREIDILGALKNAG